MITITLIIFLNSLINIAKKVKGTAKLKPSLSGIAAPKIIPKNVVVCQITQQVNPPPIKWKYLFFCLFFLKYSFDTAKAWSIKKYEIIIFQINFKSETCS